MKKVVWIKKTLKVIQSFPDSVKKELGFFLFKLQRGEILEMPHSRSMPTVAKGCFELRVKAGDGSYRVFYLLKIENKVIVFHAFKKKTQKTPVKEINIARKNLKELNEKD